MSTRNERIAQKMMKALLAGKSERSLSQIGTKRYRYVVCEACGRNFNRFEQRVPDQDIEKHKFMDTGNMEWICPYCGADNNPKPR